MGSGTKHNHYIRLVIVGGVVVLMDQITKAIILKTLPLYHSIAVIPGFFNLTHIHNPGGAFGFLANQSSGLRSFFFLFVSLLAVGLIFYFYKKTPAAYSMLSNGFALILGGAIGNLIDRFRFGKVVDFLDFFIGNTHWPAFNVADSAIFVGMAIFIFHLLFKKMPL
jgi:signal peptidase II